MANVFAMNSCANNSSTMSYAETMSFSSVDLIKCGVARLVLAISAFSIFIGRIIGQVIFHRIIKENSDFRIRA